MNHAQLALLDALLVSGDLKRLGDWLIGDAQDEEILSIVRELTTADRAEMCVQAGTIGIRFSEAIRQYIS